MKKKKKVENWRGKKTMIMKRSSKNKDKRVMSNQTRKNGVLK